MELDIKRAFLSPFSDIEWHINLSLLVFISIFASLLRNNFSNLPQVFNHIIYAILFLILAGFYTQFQHNEINNEKPLLPKIKSKCIKYLKYGLNVSIITTLYIMVSVSFFGVFNAILSKFLLISHIPHISESILIALLVIGLLITIIFFFVLATFFSVWTLALCAYADFLKLNVNMNLFYLFKMIKYVKSEMFVYILILFTLLCPFLKYANPLLENINIIFFIAQVILVYIQLILFNLAAQVYRLAKVRLANTEILAQDA